METEPVEPNDRDQEALKQYQESRKRPRSGYSSSLSDCPLDSLQIKKEKIDELSWPTESVWRDDPTGLYGIKREFLRILGIEPPITNWVVVENFRCDKSELREILELAGYVVVCSVIHGQQKHAKVMYSHALEAVQAVSMFNKQIFYGRTLSVTMLKFPLTHIILPKGLQNIGPGFGTNGKPLKDIVKQFERFVDKEPNSINTCLFYDTNESQSPGSIDTIDGDKSNEDFNEKFQFKQFIIRNVEDDNEDSKSEAESTKDCSSAENNTESRRTSLSKYSPRSPTRSPALADDDKMNARTLSHNPFPSKNVLVRETSKPNNTINPSGPTIRPSGGAAGPVPASNFSNNTLRQTPVQGPIIGHNTMSAIGPGFRANTPITGPEFRHNAPVSNALPGSVNPRFGSAGPMAAPNVAPGPIDPRTRPVAHVAGPHTMPGFNGPAIRPNGPVAAPNSGPHSSGFSPTPPTTVQFRNLPPSTTFPILCDKMAQCGQVMSIQLTSPGCANVVFSHPSHAQRCFQMYNKYMVDGYLIEARII